MRKQLHGFSVMFLVALVGKIFCLFAAVLFLVLVTVFGHLGLF